MSPSTFFSSWNTVLKEHPELDTPELKADIEEAANLSLKLELDFIDKVYEMGDLKGCAKYDLISFIGMKSSIKKGFWFAQPSKTINLMSC